MIDLNAWLDANTPGGSKLDLALRSLYRTRVIAATAIHNTGQCYSRSLSLTRNLGTIWTIPVPAMGTSGQLANGGVPNAQRVE